MDGPRQQLAGTPPLPMTVSIDELVDHLNQQSGDMSSWQCTDMGMEVAMPWRPALRLRGSVACESPNRFHLTARNIVAEVDLGSNSERCWVLMNGQPNNVGTISWRHADAHLIHATQTEIPYIDPDWLMLVLGVKRLNADDYMLEPSPYRNNRELILTSVRDTPGSGIDRYEIKVDTTRRVVHEHLAYDDRGRLVVRATLDRHRSFGGHLLPQEVRLEFPGNGTQLNLKFRNIETNVSIATTHWKVPSKPGKVDVDLVQLINARSVGTKSAQSAPSRERWTDAEPTEPAWSDASPVPEPEWNRPISQTRVIGVGFDDSGAVSRSMWQRVLDPFHLIGN